jgi:hypothetical protein
MRKTTWQKYRQGKGSGGDSATGLSTVFWLMGAILSLFFIKRKNLDFAGFSG